MEARLAVFEQREEPELKGTKRKRHIVPSNFVYLENMRGDEEQLPKFKRRMNISDAVLQERCEEGVQLLVAAGVPVSNVNLRSLGIGAKSVNVFIAKSKEGANGGE